MASSKVIFSKILLLIMSINFLKPRPRVIAATSLLGLHVWAAATGVAPDTTVLLISQKTSIAQMGVQNSDPEPLLLLTTIVEIGEQKSTTVYAVPTVTRVEPGARQIVRFVLDETEAPLKVQQLKRVLFEGIPAVKTGVGGTVQTTIRHDLPVIISPAGLEEDPAPWKKLQLRWADNQLTLSNPSPYVVRLSQIVSTLSNNTNLNILPRTYVLPGESFSIAVPGGLAADVNELRLYPASPYGFDVPPFDAKLER